MALKFNRVAFEASRTTLAQEARERLIQRYGNYAPDEAQVIVALGGDGFMLQTLHRHMAHGLPLYGMKLGNVGFLMNQFKEENLLERLQHAHIVKLHPLRMNVERASGETQQALALNEVSLLRQTRQTAHIRISVNNRERLPALVCDGILVSTPAGSTAYNLSANGPILPLDAGLLALTPISPFRPRRWRGALLPRESSIRLEALDPEKRPVSATADAFEVRNVVAVDVTEVRDITLQLMFEPDERLDERIIGEQFLP